MNTFLIIIQISLMIFALYKKIPPYGFYDMLTCLVVLFMAALGMASLAVNFKIEAITFVSAASVIMAGICTYGLKKQPLASGVQS